MLICCGLLFWIPISNSLCLQWINTASCRLEPFIMLLKLCLDMLKMWCFKLSMSKIIIIFSIDYCFQIYYIKILRNSNNWCYIRIYKLLTNVVLLHYPFELIEKIYYNFEFIYFFQLFVMNLFMRSHYTLYLKNVFSLQSGIHLCFCLGSKFQRPLCLCDWCF